MIVSSLNEAKCCMPFGKCKNPPAFSAFPFFSSKVLPVPMLKRPRYNGHIFIIGMKVRRHFIASRNLESEHVQSLFRRIASYYGELRSLWERWRCRAPLQLVCGNCNMLVVGNRKN